MYRPYVQDPVRVYVDVCMYVCMHSVGSICSYMNMSYVVSAYLMSDNDDSDVQ